MKRLATLIALLSLSSVTATAAECVGWGGFQPPARYDSSADKALLVKDLDDDGAAEIIVSGNNVDELSAFSLLHNRGDGTFEAERLIASGFGERVEAIGDLDRDGIPDLVVSNYWSNGITLYRGKGALQFDGGTPYGTATHSGPSLIADYDHDGKPDVISLSFGSGNPVRVHLFRGIGDGTLAPKTTFDTQLSNSIQPSPRTMNEALELLAGDRTGHLAILRLVNSGVSISILAAGPGVDLSSTFADVDGIADIVDTNDNNDSHEPVFVTLANADGTFRERKQLPFPRKVAFPVGVKAGDLDGDGHADLVVSDFQATNLYYFRGNGTGDFEDGIAINAGAPVYAFEIADVNGDGYPDIVTANSDHTVSVLLNRGPCPPSRHRAARH